MLSLNRRRGTAGVLARRAGVDQLARAGWTGRAATAVALPPPLAVSSAAGGAIARGRGPCRAARFFGLGAGRRPRGALGTGPSGKEPVELLRAMLDRLYRIQAVRPH